MSRHGSLTRVILAASAGNALEWYDFSVFGYFAQQIAAAFFPAAAPRAGLLLTFATFGVSFLARPFGAALLGRYADRRGRRAALTLSILLMTFGTALMAGMPGFRSIGIWAPFGILAARLIQGFSAGGEFGSATAFMIEHAGRRAGFFGSFQFTSQAVSAILGSGVAWAVAGSLSPQDVSAWGFRLPFALGLLIGPVGWYVRRHVDETPPFRALADQETRLRPRLRDHPGQMLLAAGLVAAGTASTYITIYLPTYVNRHLHVTAGNSFAITFVASVAPLVITPVAAIASDRWGRMQVMLPMAAALGLVAWPAVLLVISHPDAATLAAVFLGLNVLRAAYTAPSAAMLADMFPVAIRSAGMSLGYTLGVVVFGGFAQLAMEWLIGTTGRLDIPGLYLAGCSAVTLSALLIMALRGPSWLPSGPKRLPPA